MSDVASRVSPAEDVIDSRDVIEYIAELEAQEAAKGLDDDELEALVALKALESEASSHPDWEYGETLIRDSYFEDYARELAEDIGAIKGDEAWPLSYIDWERATDALKRDYAEVEYAGVTYWIRA